jgi:hypothetical protein
MDKSSSLGMPMQPPRNIQEVQASKLGDAPEAPPFFIGKNQVTFQDTIFLLLHALCVFLRASVTFVFSFILLYLLQ